MPKYQRTRDEVEEAFREQRFFLRSSCAAYDDGRFSEAKRIATALYVLLFDGTGRTVSLISQLGLRRIQFVSAAENFDGVAPKLALAGVMGLPGRRAEILPWCAAPERPIERNLLNLRDWFAEPVFQESHWQGEDRPIQLGRKFTRKNLIFHLRTQDNGAHFDKAIDDQTYINLAIAKRIGVYKVNSDGQSVPFLHPHLALMRQMGWEVEETLKEIPGGPELPPPEPFPPRPFRDVPAGHIGPEVITIVPPGRR